MNLPALSRQETLANEGEAPASRLTAESASTSFFMDVPFGWERQSYPIAAGQATGANITNAARIRANGARSAQCDLATRAGRRAALRPKVAKVESSTRARVCTHARERARGARVIASGGGVRRLHRAG